MSTSLVTWGAILERESAVKHGILTLARLILPALTSVVAEVSAQDERSAPAELSVRSAHEESLLIAHGCPRKASMAFIENGTDLGCRDAF